MGLYENCPCRGCEPPERHSHCHASCERYAQWVTEKNEVLKVIRQDKKKQYLSAELLSDGYHKAVRRAGPKKRKGGSKNQ